MAAERGHPAVVQCDRGAEFTSLAVDHRAYWNRVALDFRRPAKPTDNAVVEAFNASLRRECLSHTLFAALAHAAQVLDGWRDDYNYVRPRTRLGRRNPAEFRAMYSPPSGSLRGAEGEA